MPISARHAGGQDESSRTNIRFSPEVDANGALVHPVPDDIYSGSSSSSRSDETTATSRRHGGVAEEGNNNSNNNKPGQIDFQALALKHAGFAKVLKKNGQVDFSEPESVRQLTLALAQSNHAITLSLPTDRLCPPIPNRFNYVLFLKRLLDASLPLTAAEYLNLNLDDSNDDDNAENNGRSHPLVNRAAVLGIDIGTGASAIYPLLALRQFASWRMLATEIDRESLRSATENVRRNGLDGRCRVVEAEDGSRSRGVTEGSAPVSSSDEHGKNTTSTATGKSNKVEKHDDSELSKAPPSPPSSWLVPISTLARMGGGSDHNIVDVDFTMTNPPFYTSAAALLESARLKKRPPNSACTGAEIEMVYSEGGEVGWVKRLIDESMFLRARTMRKGSIRPAQPQSPVQVQVRVRWCTTMLGHLSSVGSVLQLLKQRGCTNYVVTEFVQGTKTKRWGVAWSWEGWRVDDAVLGRGLLGGGVEKGLLPVSTRAEWAVDVGSDPSRSGLASKGKPKGRGDEASWKTIAQLVDEVIEELDDAFDESDDDGGDDDAFNPEAAGIRWRWNVASSTGLGVCMQGDCWSRKARRAREMRLRERKQPQQSARMEKSGTKGATSRRRRGAGVDADGDQAMHDDGDDGGGDEEPDQDLESESEPESEVDQREQHPQLVFKVTVTRDIDDNGSIPSASVSASASATDKAHISVRWLFGHDPILFESLCGWLRRKVRERLAG